MRVEDFIRVRKVRTRTTHPAVLLDLILAEKIKDNAIRFETVETFEELYSALQRNITGAASTEICKTQIRQIRQGITESVNSYTQRYNAKWNELRYAIEAQHRLPTKRKLVLQTEEEYAIRTYINGLREEYANRG